jgi:hypothetical protein
MEEPRYTAMLNKDVDTLNCVLHDKPLYVHSSGDKHTEICNRALAVWIHENSPWQLNALQSSAYPSSLK